MENMGEKDFYCKSPGICTSSGWTFSGKYFGEGCGILGYGESISCPDAKADLGQFHRWNLSKWTGDTEYLSDHLVFRKQFTAAKTTVSLATGNRDINGAYVGSDGYLFEKIVDTDIEEETFRTNVQELKNYFEQITEYVDEDCMSILLAPAPASVGGLPSKGCGIFRPDTVF